MSRRAGKKFSHFVSKNPRIRLYSGTFCLFFSYPEICIYFPCPCGGSFCSASSSDDLLHELIDERVRPQQNRNDDGRVDGTISRYIKFSLELKAQTSVDAYSKSRRMAPAAARIRFTFFMVTSFLNSLLVYGCTFMVDGKGGSVKQKNLHDCTNFIKTI